jgi:hypothetical protein
MPSNHASSPVAQRPHRIQAAMLRLLGGALFAAVLGTAMLASEAAHAQSRGVVARFDGGIGVTPATWAGANNLAPTGGAAAANNVNDTPPPGRPWGISDLKAEIFANGNFDIRGKGLILTGGGNIGRSGNVNVRARLYCGPNGTLGKFTSEETVQLATNGDFRLRGQFDVTNQPLDCPNAVLLILNAGQSAANAGGWFAAGIPKE